jgi:hypothetical protein
MIGTLLDDHAQPRALLSEGEEQANLRDWAVL